MAGRRDRRELTREEGETLAEAVGETHGAAAIMRYYAGQRLEPNGEVYPVQGASTLLFARRELVGVAAAITPWNFPFWVSAWKLVPALAYGNTVVWKPSEFAPVSALHVYEALRDAGLPAGALNIVLGAGDVGASS